MLSADDFGTSVSITHVGGPGPYALEAIFDSEYFQAETLDGAAVNARELRLTLNVDDLQAPLRKGDAVTIDAVDHTVASYQPDGTGIAEVILAL